LADHHVAVTALSHLKARTSSVPYASRWRQEAFPGRT